MKKYEDFQEEFEWVFNNDDIMEADHISRETLDDNWPYHETVKAPSLLVWLNVYETRMEYQLKHPMILPSKTRESMRWNIYMNTVRP